MDKYVDSFLIPVPKSKLDEYKELAQLAAIVWKEHGAIDYFECLADDLSDGGAVSYAKSVNLKEDETVVFACITYKNREHRDLVNKNSMEDPRMANYDVSKIPFDSKRMIWGGFKGFVG